MGGNVVVGDFDGIGDIAASAHGHDASPTDPAQADGGAVYLIPGAAF